MSKKQIWLFFILFIIAILCIVYLWELKKLSLNTPSIDTTSCANCNVILISLDTLRAKSLPCFGYEKNTVPHLCDFADKSLLFTNTISQSSYTLDSHMSLFTSLYPTSHGVATPYIHTLSKDIKTLAEVLKEQGYQTYFLGTGIYDDPHLPLKQGLGRGFDTIISADDPKSWMESLDKIDLKSNKFFAFLHTFYIHHPYVPKPEYVNKIYSNGIPEYSKWYGTCKTQYDQIRAVHPEIFPNRDRGDGYNYCDEIAQFYIREGVNGKPGELLENESLYKQFMEGYYPLFQSGPEASKASEYYQALYEAKIAELDDQLEQFFAYLQKKDLLRNTVIIIFGDHGEGLLQHGQLTHGQQLYNEVIHVPLIISIPNVDARKVHKLSQLIDVMPTILPILHIPTPSQAQGINLLSYTVPDYVFSEVSIDRKRAIIGKKWKLIVNYDRGKGTKEREFYNLASDIDEKTNLIQYNEATANKLEALLNQNVAGRKLYRQGKSGEFPSYVTEEERRNLLQTGYR